MHSGDFSKVAKHFNCTTVKRYFDYLQICRGIAALMVVVHHTYPSMQFFRKFDNTIIEGIAHMGKFGVDFFFVLSGFIIAYTTYEKSNQSKKLKNYCVNRLIRIFVPYLPIGILMYVLYLIVPSMSSSVRDINFWNSVFLVPIGNPALSVAWTLSFELCFYLIYSIYFVTSRKAFFALLAGWFVLIVISNFITPIQFLGSTHLLNLYNLEFLMGVVVACLSKNKPYDSKVLLFAFIVLFIPLIYIRTNGLDLGFKFSLNFLFALSTSLLVFYLVNSTNKKFKSISFFMMLGNSSYSLYLLHNPLQSLLVRLLPDFNNYMVVFVEFLFVIFICCAMSYIYYLIFEKKLLNFIKAKLFCNAS